MCRRSTSLAAPLSVPRRSPCPRFLMRSDSFGRSVHPAISRRCRPWLCKRTCFDYYDDFGALLASARPSLRVPTSRAALLRAHDLPGAMGELRAAFASDRFLAADLLARLERRRADEGSTTALKALIATLCRRAKPLSQLLRPHAHDPHDPVRRRGALASGSRYRGQDGVRRRLRAAAVRAAATIFIRCFRSRPART